MELPKLRAMFSYLRRAFTTKESRELLSGFFPSSKPQIDGLSDGGEPTVEAEVDDAELSKMARARKLYATAPNKSRKAIIRLFLNNIPDMAHTTASTYYYQIAADRERSEPMIDQARRIYASSPVKTRKAIVTQYVAIGMPENVASTYYYKCRKEERDGRQD